LRFRASIDARFPPGFHQDFFSLDAERGEVLMSEAALSIPGDRERSIDFRGRALVETDKLGEAFCTCFGEVDRTACLGDNGA